MSQGILIVLSGPSGTGKDSILKEMLMHRNDIKVSISCTTRKPRKGEINNKDYFFITEPEFDRMVKQNQMLEWAKFCGNFYGTPKSEVEKLIYSGINVILEIEVQGAKQIINSYPEAVSIFILPPSIKVLRERLEKRGLDSKKAVEERLLESRREINLAYDYQYVVVNDNLKECARDILKIIDSEKMKTKYRKNIIEGVFNYERIIDR